MSSVNKNDAHEESIEETWELINPPEKKPDSPNLGQDCAAVNHCDGTKNTTTINLEECTEEEFEILFGKEGQPVEKKVSPPPADGPAKHEVWTPWVLLNPTSVEERNWGNELLENDRPLAVPAYEKYKDTPESKDSGGKSSKYTSKLKQKLGGTTNATTTKKK